MLNQLTASQGLLENQGKELVSLTDKLNVTASQIKLLESTGVKHSPLEEQSTSLEKVRENLRAEVNLVVNSRIMEELQTFDDKINKRLEENDKKVKAVEKKTDSFKESIEEGRKEQEHLLARIDDIAKLVAELTVAKTPKNDHQQEEIGTYI